MDFKHNIYHRKCRGKTTFQSKSIYMPPPPPPPEFFIPPVQQWAQVMSDEAIVKQFESKLTNVQPKKTQLPISISKVHDEIRNLVLTLNEIKLKQKVLSDKINDLSDEEWSTNLKEIEGNKTAISQILSKINNLNTEVLRKLLAKRSAKRARQKRQRIEKKKEKEERIKLNKEKSRKIDEFVKTFQDDIIKAKQEKEAKLKADAVLRETIHKKQGAKKYIVKLDALMKLRKARQNTAKGRGVNVSEKETEVFEKNIEKLKSMWSKRLAMYQEEEKELLAQLDEDSEEVDTKAKETDSEVTKNLEKWKEVLFAGTLPQVDFAGNISSFLAVRSQWDQHLNSEGSSIPIGWVPPTAVACQTAV